MEHDRWLRACEAAYPSVYRALLGLGATPADAADALQDAFERAIVASGEMRSPEGWLFVARRRWRALRWRSRLFGPLGWLRDEPSTAEPRADYLVLRAELGRLTERQREVLVMRYLPRTLPGGNGGGPWGRDWDRCGDRPPGCGPAARAARGLV